MNNQNLSTTIEYKNFITDIKKRILKGQYEALKSVNKELISLYWDIPKSIVQRQEEYGWGKSIVKIYQMNYKKSL